jgi:hypothetical protein
MKDKSNNLQYWEGYTPETLRASLPVKKNRRKDEAKLQKACKDLHRMMFPEDWKIVQDNGSDKIVSCFYSNYTNAQSGHGGAIADAQGRSSGVADYTWICPGNRTRQVELKTEIGKQSKAQKEWQAMVEARGHSYHIFRSLEKFQALCEEEKNLRRNGA